MELPQLQNLTPEDRKKIEDWATAYKKEVIASLSPSPDQFGLRQLPREPGNQNKFLTTFKTDAHIYTIIGDSGIGFHRYTQFQKLSLQRGFGRDFGQIFSELEKIKLIVAGAGHTPKGIVEAVVNLSALQDSVADFSKEQFDAGLWLCTMFVLREDENMASFSEAIAKEKIEDWANYGYSELDFFFLSGNLVPGYGNAFKEALKQSELARQKLMGVINTNGRLSKESEAS